MREFVRVELEDEGGGGGVLRYLRWGGLGLGGTSMFLLSLFQTKCENVKKRETSSSVSSAKKNKKKVSVAKCQKKNRQK